MTHLYLIRHGEAASNVDGTVAGMHGDEGLTALGKQQAERLRDRLALSGEIAADILIASTLPRARQTAEIIAPALELPIIFDEDVQEMRVGEADGMSQEAFRTTYGLPDFRKEPFRPIAPRGESYPQFVLRVGEALDRITREHAGRTIVVVCHGGVIDASFNVFFGLHSLKLPDIELYTHNTSITHWERRQREEAAARWRLVSYNDDTHVRDILTDGRVHWETRPGKMADAEGDDAPNVPLPAEERTGA